MNYIERVSKLHLLYEGRARNLRYGKVFVCVQPRTVNVRPCDLSNC